MSVGFVQHPCELLLSRITDAPFEVITWLWRHNFNLVLAGTLHQSAQGTMQMVPFVILRADHLGDISLAHRRWLLL